MSTAPPFVITGLVYDNGVTNNQAAIYRQIAAAIAAGYGEAVIPPDPSGAYAGTEDVVLGSVILEVAAGALTNPSGGGYLTINVGSAANANLLLAGMFVTDLTATGNILAGTTVASTSGATVTLNNPVNARTTTDTIVFSTTTVPTGLSFGLVGLGEGLREAPGTTCPPVQGFPCTAIGPCAASSLSTSIAPIQLSGSSYVRNMILIGINTVSSYQSQYALYSTANANGAWADDVFCWGGVVAAFGSATGGANLNITNLTANNNLFTLPIDLTAGTVTGSHTIPLTSTLGIGVGSAVTDITTGGHVPPSTVVTAVNNASVTVNNNVSSATGDTLQFTAIESIGGGYSNGLGTNNAQSTGATVIINGSDTIVSGVRNYNGHIEISGSDCLWSNSNLSAPSFSPLSTLNALPLVYVAGSGMVFNNVAFGCGPNVVSALCQRASSGSVVLVGCRYLQKSVSSAPAITALLDTQPAGGAKPGFQVIGGTIVNSGAANLNPLAYFLDPSSGDPSKHQIIGLNIDGNPSASSGLMISGSPPSYNLVNTSGAGGQIPLIFGVNANGTILPNVGAGLQGATNASLVVTGGVGTVPTIATNTLDVIANLAATAAAADWSNNSHRITGLIAASASGGAMAYGLNSLDQLAQAAGSYSMNSNRLESLASPVVASDAAPASYAIPDYLIANGLAAAPYDPAANSGTTITLSNALYLWKVILHATSVSHGWMNVQTAGSAGSGAKFFMLSSLPNAGGTASPVGGVVATSAVDTAVQSVNSQSFAFSVSGLVLGAEYWLCLWLPASWGSTYPILRTTTSSISLINMNVNSVTAYRGASVTGVTDPTLANAWPTLGSNTPPFLALS